MILIESVTACPERHVLPHAITLSNQHGSDQHDTCVQNALHNGLCKIELLCKWSEHQYALQIDHSLLCRNMEAAAQQYHQRMHKSLGTSHHSSIVKRERGVAAVLMCVSSNRADVLQLALCHM